MRLIIISGRSGSGKSTALHQLEDEGFYCIDNLPLGLLPPLTANLIRNRIADRISVGIDARNIAADLRKFPEFIEKIDKKGIELQIVYLDSAASALVDPNTDTRFGQPWSAEKLPGRT